VLPVSELIEVARGQIDDDELRSRSPMRFSATGQHAPVVIWNVCMHCNMKCPHCYASAIAEPSPTDLTHDEGLRLLEDLASCGVRVVIFSGGEPLMREDLFVLIVHARGLGIAPQLSTNGVLIDEHMAARLARAGVAYVGISIDGLPEFNDDYRGLEGGHAKALDGLRHAKGAGMKTGLRMTLSRRNVDQLQGMIDVAQGVSVDRFYVSHLVYSGRGFKVAHEDLSRAQVRSALLRLFERADELASHGLGPGIVTGSNDSDGVLLLQWIEARFGEAAGKKVRELLLQRGGNSAGERVLDIDSRGRVHPDQFWRGAVLGDVRKESFAEILEHPLREQLSRRLEFLTGRCGVCSERALCRGSHRERALAMYRDPWASDPACVMEDSEIGIPEAAEVSSG
jgi:radical SAM protein with 4Fe4S-binding SPASM domain